MAVTQADLDAMDTAIASGERQVTIGDQSVTYNTSDAMLRARAHMQGQFNRQQAKAEGRRLPARQTLMVYGGRGYND